jgi:hypothetical protein
MINTELLRDISLGKDNIKMNISETWAEQNELVQSKVHFGNYFSDGHKT